MSVMCFVLVILYIYNHVFHNYANTIPIIQYVSEQLCIFALVFQSVTQKMRSKLETPSDAENVVTESCTRKGPKDVSFKLNNA